MSEFRFDKNYNNTEQVRHLMPAYLRRYKELRKQGQYPYNDSFKGHLGITGDEDTAIYLCQELRSLDELRQLVDEALAEGFVPVETVGTPIRGSVIRYGWYTGGTGFQRWDNVKLVPGITGLAVQRPRQRTRGINLFGGHVLVKAAC